MTTDAAPPVPSASPPDAASSLRAAALLTLKSKRRKNTIDMVTTVPSLPSRPPPSDAAIHLDYGQEEESPTSPVAPPMLTSDLPKSEPPSPAHAEDVQMREEGEISDEETAKSPSPPTSHPSSPLLPVLDAPQLSRRSTPTIPTAQGMSSKPQLSRRIAEPVSSSTVGANATLTPLCAENITPHESIDAEHVRPGVALTQSQYDAAKDIILDLLGWGVHPEYLVDCGLTREIVFHVFHELNLRLPQNLDTTGLVPYTPEIQSSIEPQKTSSMPPPPPVQVAAHLIPREGSSPVRDIAAPSQTPNISPSRTDRSNSIDTPRTPSANSLHDMEQQRKQELLARKAAIASRKSKQFTSSDTSIPTSQISYSHALNVNLTEETLVPTETVDDFLKSIDPNSITITKDIVGPSHTDSMDVDGRPGLNAVASVIRETQDFSTPRSHAAKVSATDFILPSSSTSSSDDQQSTNSSGLLTRASSFDPTGLPEGQHRRGVKRPVAVDFDDFDNGPRPSNSNGSQHGSRRKIVAGFANVSQRRCVIELSDSEGDGDGDATTRDVTLARRTTYPSPFPPRATIAVNSSNGWITPPASNIVPNANAGGIASSGTMSPAALRQKEREIQKMKEMIAVMEQSRSIKLAKSASLTGTMDDPTSLVVKQEEVDHLCAMDNLSNQSATTYVGVNNAFSIEHGKHDGIADNTKTTTTNQGEVLWTKVISDSMPYEASTKDSYVDVDSASSSSAQVLATVIPAHQKPDENQDQWPHQEQPDLQTTTTTYESPLRLYPLLAPRPRPTHIAGLIESSTLASSSKSSSSSVSSTLSPFVVSSSSSASSLSFSSSAVTSPQLMLDFGPLKLATASKLLDPLKRICRYEVPGGGVCRDEGCEDAHLSRIVGPNGNGGEEPSDQETAEYLVNTLSVTWLTENGASLPKLVSALQQGRYKNPQMAFEQRVSQALTAVQPC